MRSALLCMLAICFALAGPVSRSRAQQVTPPEAPNWCAVATANIEKIDGKPFTCALARRCIRMNNYGCVKQTAVPLPGTTWGGYSRGARDAQGHALFEDPRYSLAKMIGLLARYQRAGLSSALLIQERYAPWCDTLGSKPYNAGWGRACRGERDHPAARVGYTPMCGKPASGVSTRQQCAACNCPDRAAVSLVANTGVGATQPLALFDAAGRANPVMAQVLRNLARQEQGVTVSAVFAQKAVDAYNEVLPAR